MDNLDEKIIALRNLQKSQNGEQSTQITDGVYINDNFLTFHEVEMLEDKITMLLPEDFTTMREDIAKIKYPSESRPQCIKTSRDTAVNIGMSLFPAPIDENNLDNELNDLKKILKNVNPAFEFYRTDIEDLEDFKLGWFDYKSFAIDQQMYNIMFVASIDGQMLHGFFNCPYSGHDQWMDAALQMIRSIKRKKLEVRYE